MQYEINERLIQEAWRVRIGNFSSSIFFHYPVLTETISVTGDKCALNCAHCNGRFLKNMTPLNKFWKNNTAAKKCIEKKPVKKIKSCLISGGCDSDGRVPFAKYIDELKELKKKSNLRLNFHAGLVGENEASLLKGLADVVSFDFVGDNGTISRVLGLEKLVEDYAASYKILRKYTRVVPHICIGLDGGKIVGEYRALDLLCKLGVEEVVFLVLMPARGTQWEKKPPPSLSEVVHFLARARIKFPDIPIHLGCMRPGGRYRRLLDRWAVRCGVNHIVMPASDAVSESNKLGLTLNYREECCVL